MRLKQYKCPYTPAEIKNFSGECVYSSFEAKCKNCGLSYNDSRTVWNYIDHKVHGIRCRWKNFWQRRIRGFDDSEISFLNHTCARFMAPRMLAFIEHTKAWGSVPSCLTEQDGSDPLNEKAFTEWITILEKIQNAFQLILDDDDADYLYEEEQRAKIKEGLDLFQEWFHYLWI